MNKGLNYIPTFSLNKVDFLADFHKFCRTLRLKIFFAEKEINKKETTVPIKLRNKSKFDPNIINSTLETFELIVKEEVTQQWERITESNKRKRNLTKKETMALKTLKEEKTTILKKADKGGATVLMNLDDYMEEAYNQLQDQKVYRKLTKDPTTEIKREIDIFLQEAYEEDLITEELLKVLVNNEPRTPILYLVPKVHKRLQKPPGRPIVSGIGSIFQPLAIYVDSFLQNIVKELPHCLKDTTDFLNRLDTVKTDQATWLCTYDIKSLYTSIPTQEGMEATREKLKNDPKLSNRDISFLMTLLDFVLTRNYFRFGSEYYLQLQGTSMGSPVAPGYANVFMDMIETQIILQNQLADNVIAWYRFVDDIFVLWKGTEIQLDAFTLYLNSIHPLLEFTITKDPVEISFLDVKVMKKEGVIHTTLFTKETDKNNLLKRDSFHAPQTFGGIPKGQLMRVKRICSNDEECGKNMSLLTEKFVKRGYNRVELNKTVNEVKQMERKDLRAKKDKNKKQNDINFTYDHHSNMIRTTINKAWFVLQSDPAIKKLFHARPRFIYRKGKSISNHLIRSDLKKDTIRHTNKDDKKGTFPCLSCQNCSAIIKGTVVHHPTRGHPIKIKDQHNCNSQNVIYLLKCPCGKYYVGQTSRAIKIRINEHVKRASQTSEYSKIKLVQKGKRQ